MDPSVDDVPPASSPRVALLPDLLGQAYARHAWHDSKLRNAVRRVSPDPAAFRPQPGRHDLREITVHCAYWKEHLIRSLDGAGVRFELRASG